MKILVLTWEFPPRIVGGIARHVAELYPEIVQLGHEIHLITVQFGAASVEEAVEGVWVHRVPVAESHNFFDWVGKMNVSMGEYGGRLLSQDGSFDLIHAHDWLVGDAAIALKHRFKLPMIATIHATEHGRNNGIHTDIQRYVNQKERMLAHEAWQIIVCTQYMRREVSQTLHMPLDKLNIVYNGIRAEKKQLDPNFNAREFRRQFAQDDEKIVYYVGRITHEKGIGNLLKASPTVLKALDQRVKIVIIGGGNVDHLKWQATDLGIHAHCRFTGFMPDEELDKFQVIADCAVFPSLYEPFGIVALESFAARVPVVVSDAGGLPEVVQDGKTGVVALKNDPDSIALGILQILSNPDYAEQLVENAYKDLIQRFCWNRLAQQTAAIYDRVMAERSQIRW
jgi:glycosyltransferase involved in cell wall biosynthesis